MYDLHINVAWPMYQCITYVWIIITLLIYLLFKIIGTKEFKQVNLNLKWEW